MTAWDVLDRLMASFPPVAAAILFIAAAVIFIVGFSKHGFNFLKYGFGKIDLDKSLDDRFDRLEARLDSMDRRFDGIDARLDSMDRRFDGIDSRLDGMDARFATIETNHFGHLKNYLGIVNGILLDKQIIDNETKARLDNELRDM